MQTGIDWSLLRFLYEIHGATEADLAEENGTTERMVCYVRDQQKWKRSALALSARDWSQLESIDETTLEEVQQRMATMSLLKQFALNPKLQAFESSLLTKAIDTTRSLDPSIPSTAEALLKLGNLLEKLKASNPAIQTIQINSGESESGSGAVNVQIVTEFNKDKQDSVRIATRDTQRLAHSSVDDESTDDNSTTPYTPVKIATSSKQ